MVAAKKIKPSRNGKAPAIPDGVGRLSAAMVYNALMKGENLVGGPFANVPWAWRNLGGNNSNIRAIDIDKECQYPEEAELNAQYFSNAYRRWGISARVVNIWPDECWASHPEVYETEKEDKTEFEKAWQKLSQKLLAFHYLHRVDRVSGIGQFGILFLGLSDGGRLDRAPPGINGKTGEPTKDGKKTTRTLNYIRAFDQSLVTIKEVDTDQKSPRCGQPKIYSIKFIDPEVAIAGTAEPSKKSVTSKSLDIHWTRVVHVADNRLTSEIFGEPRLKKVINYLVDIRKIGGGAGQMFWAGGFPGYAFETNPDQVNPELNDDTLKETMDAYVNGLKRYLATVGGTWKSLQPQVANPDKHLQWNINLICTTLGVPLRIFMGSESGQLASTQDDAAWRTRCSERQKNYLEPMILRPFIDRLIMLGVLPTPKLNEGQYYVDWKDLRALSDDARVGVALKKCQALMTYVTGNVNQIVPQRFLLTLVMGFTEDQADAIIQELKENPPEPTIEQQQLEQQAKLAEQQAKQADQQMKIDKTVARSKLGPTPGGGRNNRTPVRGKPGRPANAPPPGSTSRAAGRPSTSIRRPTRRPAAAGRKS